ncbi:MAG: NAD(+) kinase [Gammaproteobacteria bacterium]
MNTGFNTIGIYGNHRHTNIQDTLQILVDCLQQRQINLFLETETADLCSLQLPTYSMSQLAEYCDLLIVVGGDGSLLTAARAAIQFDTPVVGINRGKLGFLADILPQEVEIKINEILNGNYQIEQRFLLHAELYQGEKLIYTSDALNDVALLPGKLAHMISFNIIVNDSLVCRQRADGLIVATPTGSTAYALSGGGPILHPQLNAIVLVPMFPHTLSSRPIVIDGSSRIKLNLANHAESPPCISCDGQERILFNSDNHIIITQQPNKVRLIHPPSYNYYETLRVKLGWENRC